MGPMYPETITSARKWAAKYGFKLRVRYVSFEDLARGGANFVRLLTKDGEPATFTLSSVPGAREFINACRLPVGYIWE